MFLILYHWILNLIKRIESNINIHGFSGIIPESHKENWKTLSSPPLLPRERLESHKENWKAYWAWYWIILRYCESHKENWKWSDTFYYGHNPVVESHKENWKTYLSLLLLFSYFMESHKENWKFFSFTLKISSWRHLNLIKRIESIYPLKVGIYALFRNLIKRIERSFTSFLILFPIHYESHKENWKKT